MRLLALRAVSEIARLVAKHVRDRNIELHRQGSVCDWSGCDEWLKLYLEASHPGGKVGWELVFVEDYEDVD